MTLSGFVTRVSKVATINVYTSGNHRKPDGRFTINTAALKLVWNHKPGQTSVPDPTYFDQFPYEEFGRRIDGRLVVNPVLHMKLTGTISSSFPGLGEAVSGYDCIHDTLNGWSEPILVGPGVSGALTVLSTADNAASYSANVMENHVSWNCTNYPLGDGRNLCVIRFAEVCRDTGFSAQRKRGGAKYRLSARMILWNDDNWVSVSRYRDASGTSRSATYSIAVPALSGNRGNLDAEGVEHYFNEYQVYAGAFLGEALSVSSAGGTPGVHPYDEVEDRSLRALSYARSLNPLSFLYGEIWRGLYSLNEMSAEALDSLPGFEGNGPMLAKDLPALAQTAFACAEGIARVCTRLIAGGRGQYAQSSASLLARSYLSDHFGLRLTLADLKEALQQELRGSSARKRLSSMRAGSCKNGNWVARYCIYYTDLTALDLQEALKRLDVEIDASNVWDSIPWSFIVDWFYNLGNFFQKCDNYYTIRKEFHCLGTVDSLRIDRVIAPGEIHPPDGIRADLHFSYYRRHVGSAPAIPLSNETTNPTLTNMVEGAAIVVASLP